MPTQKRVLSLLKRKIPRITIMRAKARCSRDKFWRNVVIEPSVDWFLHISQLYDGILIIEKQMHQIPLKNICNTEKFLGLHM
jgi:hypothetical protein